jgi:hypothetical protein
MIIKEFHRESGEGDLATHENEDERAQVFQERLSSAENVTLYKCGCRENETECTYELCPQHENMAAMEWFP